MRILRVYIIIAVPEIFRIKCQGRRRFIRHQFTIPYEISQEILNFRNNLYLYNIYIIRFIFILYIIFCFLINNCYGCNQQAIKFILIIIYR